MDNGCFVYSTNDTATVCACYHLTDFSVFLPPNNLRLFERPIVINESNFATLGFLCALFAFYLLWLFLILFARCPPAYHALVDKLAQTRLLQPSLYLPDSNKLVRLLRLHEL